jgi:hypothetical protein
MVANLNEMRDWPLSEVPDEYLEAVIDQGIRHRSNPKPVDYLNGFLRIARMQSDTPQDGTWGEAERAVAVIVRRMLVAERRCAVLEAQVTDLQQQLAAALAAEGGPP